MPDNLIHPDKQQWIDTGDEEINALMPELSSKERSYLKTITSENYATLCKNIEKYLDVKPTQANLPTLVGILFNTVPKVIQIESAHKQQLEELALALVLGMDEYKMVEDAYLDDHITFKVSLARPETTDYKMEEGDGELTQEEELNLDLANLLDGANLSNVSARRRFANLLITGGSFSKMYLFHLAEEKLNKIDPNLTKYYGALGVLAELGYWVTPDGISEQAAKSDSQKGGVSEVKPEGDKYVIIAKAITFPYLVHEIVKGIQEYLSLSPEFQKVLGKEKLEDEPRDVIAGAPVYKKVVSYVPNDKQYLLPLIQRKVIQLEPSEIKDILASNPNGKKVMDDLIKSSEDEWDDYKRNKADFSAT